MMENEKQKEMSFAELFEANLKRQAGESRRVLRVREVVKIARRQSC